jgi:hypothetical protein
MERNSENDIVVFSSGYITCFENHPNRTSFIVLLYIDCLLRIWQTKKLNLKVNVKMFPSRWFLCEIKNVY